MSPGGQQPGLGPQVTWAPACPGTWGPGCRQVSSAALPGHSAQPLGQISMPELGRVCVLFVSSQPGAWAAEERPVPPLVSVQAFLRVSAQAGQGRVGPWAPAPGRWVAGRGVGPPAGRRPCGQLCFVGASSLALCSVKALSQTAPLFSCWDCWEVGRPDSGPGSNTGCWGCSGCVSMPLHSRPRIKAELGAGPSSAGRAGGRHPHPGLGVLPGQGAMLVMPPFQATLGGPRPLLARPCSVRRALCFCLSVSAACRPCPRGLCLLPPGGCLSLLPSAPWSLPPCLCPSALVASASRRSKFSVCPGLVSVSPCPREPVRGWGWGCL